MSTPHQLHSHPPFILSRTSFIFLFTHYTVFSFVPPTIHSSSSTIHPLTVHHSMLLTHHLFCLTHQSFLVIHHSFLLAYSLSLVTFHPPSTTIHSPSTTISPPVIHYFLLTIYNFNHLSFSQNARSISPIFLFSFPSLNLFCSSLSSLICFWLSEQINTLIH